MATDSPLLNEIQCGFKLKPTKTNDRSAPIIKADADSPLKKISATSADDSMTSWVPPPPPPISSIPPPPKFVNGDYSSTQSGVAPPPPPPMTSPPGPPSSSRSESPVSRDRLLDQLRCQDPLKKLRNVSTNDKSSPVISTNTSPISTPSSTDWSDSYDRPPMGKTGNNRETGPFKIDLMQELELRLKRPSGGPPVTKEQIIDISKSIERPPMNHHKVVTTSVVSPPSSIRTRTPSPTPDRAMNNVYGIQAKDQEVDAVNVYPQVKLQAQQADKPKPINIVRPVITTTSFLPSVTVEPKQEEMKQDEIMQNDVMTPVNGDLSKRQRDVMCGKQGVRSRTAIFEALNGASPVSSAPSSPVRPSPSPLNVHIKGPDFAKPYHPAATLGRVIKLDKVPEPVKEPESAFYMSNGIMLKSNSSTLPRLGIKVDGTPPPLPAAPPPVSPQMQAHSPTEKKASDIVISPTAAIASVTQIKQQYQNHSDLRALSPQHVTHGPNETVAHLNSVPKPYTPYGAATQFQNGVAKMNGESAAITFTRDRLARVNRERALSVDRSSGISFSTYVGPQAANGATNKPINGHFQNGLDRERKGSVGTLLDDEKPNGSYKTEVEFQVKPSKFESLMANGNSFHTMKTTTSEFAMQRQPTQYKAQLRSLGVDKTDAVTNGHSTAKAAAYTPASRTLPRHFPKTNGEIGRATVLGQPRHPAPNPIPDVYLEDLAKLKKVMTWRQPKSQIKGTVGETNFARTLNNSISSRRASEEHVDMSEMFANVKDAESANNLVQQIINSKAGKSTPFHLSIDFEGNRIRSIEVKTTTEA